MSDITTKEYKNQETFLCNQSDLLGRPEIKLEPELISDFYKDKTIFITGASGSIGSEILIQLLQLPVKKIVSFTHGEFSCYNTIQKVDHKHIIDYIIGDIRDIEKLRYVVNKYKPDICIHASALKHVFFAEKFPDETLKTNIIGSYNCALVAIENKVKHFLSISTDKSVNPTSIMGATKNIVEKIMLSLNNNQDITKFSIVRFGNVIGSRGSAIPLFKHQIENNEPITITHPDMKRFFMSISEASKLVIKSLTLDKGEIFILDMGKQIKILDIIKKLLKLYGYDSYTYPVNTIGITEGEKLEEELTLKKSNLGKTKFDRLLYLKESDHNFKCLNYVELKNMIDEFRDVAETYDKNKIIEVLKKYKSYKN